MRRNAISSAVQEEEAEINMTPMLDVVFIMLIFFIVTAVTIKKISMMKTTSSMGVILISASSSWTALDIAFLLTIFSYELIFNCLFN